MKKSLLLTVLFIVGFIPASAQSGKGFSDEFNGTQLDPTKWDVFKGSPTVANGKLVLDGGSTLADVQTRQSFLYGAVTLALESTNWQPQTGVPDAQITDASFGVEIFGGANGQCHYSAVLKANGHLGLLRPAPDAGNNCSGNPAYQEHLQLSNWDAIRAGGRVVIMLIWTPQGVTLRISDGKNLNGIAVSTPSNQAVPNVSMRIRLNADKNETYRVDYVRWAEAAPRINQNEFVKTGGGKLMIGDREFRFAGANTYYLQPQIAYDNLEGAREALDKMEALGLTVARTIGFNDHPYKNEDARCGDLKSEIGGNDPAAIQLRPGVFCEPNLVALDRAIAEAKARDVRLIIYLTNNFPAYGGIRRYVQWRLGTSPSDEQVGLFYTDAMIKQWFKDYVSMLLNRVNTITGVKYKDEPAILAWELGNELRNRTNNANERAQRIEDLLAWHREMAGYIKSLDGNHLVSDGGEGHDNNVANYPGLSNSYAVSGFESCSYSRLVNEPSIDLLSYHFYPSKWALNEGDDAEIWIGAHERLARAAGKVAYLGEFGKPFAGGNAEAFDAAREEAYDRWLRWAVEEYCTAGQIVWQLSFDGHKDTDDFSFFIPRDGGVVFVLWRYAASAAAPALATVSSATYGRYRLAPDSIASLFGTGMATTTQNVETLPLPTIFDGTQVIVRDAAGTARPGSLFYVSPTQINFLIPSGTVNGIATVKATINDAVVSCGLINVARIAPGIFTADASGKGLAAAQILRVKTDNTSVYEPIATFDTGQNRYVPVPIDLGPEGEKVYLVLYGTGLRYRTTLSQVAISVGGLQVDALYAGPSPDYQGLDQINLLLPRSLAGRGDVDVALTLEGLAANTTRIRIK